MPQTPSPQEYHITDDRVIGRPDQPAAPAWTFPGRRVDRTDVEFREAADPRPGAHEYDVTHEHLDLTKTKAPTYSMRAKHASRSRSSSPAPGAYDTPSAVGSDHPAIQNGPRYGFGSSHRDNVVGRMLAYMPETPSPQEYRVVGEKAIGRVNQKAAPSWSMGTQQLDRNDPEYKETRNPTPNAQTYNITHDHVDLTKGSAPKYSMRPRSLSRKSRSVSPGPGSYDIRRSLSRGSSPQSSSRSAEDPCGFGSAQRFQDKKPDNRIYSY
uniref:Outer dense fiber of sperm tails 3-like n=1 Tax=Karlodinium veneficum TaxID=407301 RepID=E8Z6Z6_KARVE|nr:outer dense fiber of sperm tails 3-like [Karlodinium veneficum]